MARRNWIVGRVLRHSLQVFLFSKPHHSEFFHQIPTLFSEVFQFGLKLPEPGSFGVFEYIKESIAEISCASVGPAVPWDYTSFTAEELACFPVLCIKIEGGDDQVHGPEGHQVFKIR